MKKLTHSIVISVLVFSAFYLSVSFYNSSFNINEWSIASRGVVALFGGIYGLFGAFVTYNKDE